MFIIFLVWPLCFPVRTQVIDSSIRIIKRSQDRVTAWKCCSKWIGKSMQRLLTSWDHRNVIMIWKNNSARMCTLSNKLFCVPKYWKLFEQFIYNYIEWTSFCVPKCEHSMFLFLNVQTLRFPPSARGDWPAISHNLKTVFWADSLSRLDNHVTGCLSNDECAKLWFQWCLF